MHVLHVTPLNSQLNSLSFSFVFSLRDQWNEYMQMLPQSPPAVPLTIYMPFSSFSKGLVRIINFFIL